MRSFLLSLVILALSVTPAAAMVARMPMDLETPGTNRVLELPEPAERGAMISLGSAVDPDSGRIVEGYAIPRYKEGFHHRPDHVGGPPGSGGGNGGGDDSSSCYAYLDKFTKWKTVEPWVVNPDNLDGLSSSEVFDWMSDGVFIWEDAADGTVDSSLSKDILGAGSTTTTVLTADTDAPDGANEVYFADVSSSGAIGVTIVWGIFSGPPGQRELVEWDQVYDDVDFEWTADATLEPTKMDFGNIAVHELGHSVGMADLYTDECSEETMYGYATEGEISKRDLNAGDIAGVSGLY